MQTLTDRQYERRERMSALHRLEGGGDVVVRLSPRPQPTYVCSGRGEQGRKCGAPLPPEDWGPHRYKRCSRSQKKTTPMRVMAASDALNTTEVGAQRESHPLAAPPPQPCSGALGPGQQQEAEEEVVEGERLAGQHQQRVQRVGQVARAAHGPWRRASREAGAGWGGDPGLLKGQAEWEGGKRPQPTSGVRCPM